MDPKTYEDRIFSFEGLLVLLDRDVAKLFGTTTKRLNQATLTRNSKKFTQDYARRLTDAETTKLWSQIVTVHPDEPAISTPVVYTEEGVIMTATVLKSDTAVAVTKQIVRAFIAVQRQAQEGQNSEFADPLPDPIAVERAIVPVAMSEKVAGYLDRLANITLTQKQQDAVISEVKQFRKEGFDALHAFAQRPNIKTATAAADLRKRLAEADEIEERVRKMRAETRDAERLSLIRDLVFMSTYEHAKEKGTLGEFANVLRGLDPTLK